MNRIALISKAADLSDSMLPDPSVIDATENAQEAATGIIAHWEREAAQIGETLGGVDPEHVDELRAVVAQKLVDRIESPRYRAEPITECAHCNARDARGGTACPECGRY